MTTLSTHLLPLFDRLADGNVLQLLSHECFDAAAHLLPLERIVAHLKRLAGPPGTPPDTARLKVVAHGNATIVARRLLLGRYADELAALQNLWTAYGTPAGVVHAAASAARTARERWPTSGPITFSAAHGDFVTALAKLEQADPRAPRGEAGGPLGEAVRKSRYYGAERADWDGESPHIGFPALLGAASGRSPAVWVVPDPREGWAAWKDSADEPDLAKLRAAWTELHAGLTDMDKRRPGALSPVWEMKLPEWLAFHVLRSGGHAELPSAGLAVLLQCLAETRREPLPPGVGFTGRVVFGRPEHWEDVRVRGVHGIAEKALAAREAGIFLLFACRDGNSDEPEPSVPSVRIAWIDPGSSLKQLLRKVNTACSASGLTEYRRRASEARMLERLPNAGRETEHASPLFSDAHTDRTCSVDVNERDEELSELRQARGQAVSRRSLVYLVGDPRQGKTTLLANWLFRSGDWPRLPARYSLYRQSGAAGTAEALRRAVIEQLAATYLVVRHPSHEVMEQLEAPYLIDCHPRHADALKALAQLTDDPVEVVIDGLDEVKDSQQIAILDFLGTLPGKGIVVVGTQEPPQDYAKTGKQVHLRSSLIPAYHVIDGFARRFCESSRPELHDIGSCLCSPVWRDGLARQSGGDPWVVEEFLRYIEEDRWGWPDSPEDARLTPKVRNYCRDVLEQILASRELAPDAAKIRALVNGLALLDDRPWPLGDVLFLLGLSNRFEDLARWQQTLAPRPLRRLLEISANGLQVQFRDATFRKFLRIDADAIERELLERMLALLGPGALPDRTDLSLRDAAVREAASHAVRVGAAAPYLVRRLLLETDWAFLRLRSLVSAGLSIGEMLSELVKLSDLISDQRPEEREAIDALRLALSTWQEPIQRGGVDAGQWWAALAGVQQHPVWRRQRTGEVRPGSIPLLAPVGGEEGPGYRTPARHVGHLGDAACELPDLTLVLTSQAGHLLVWPFDARARQYGKAKRRWTGMKEIRQVTAFGSRQVLVLGIDYDEGQQLRLVDLDAGSVRPWGPDAAEARLFACEALDIPGEGQREPAVLLAGVEKGQIRVSVWRAEAEVVGKQLYFGPADSHRTGQGVVRLSPTTWAAWGMQGAGEDRVFWFSIWKWQDGRITEIPDHDVTGELTGTPRAVCAGPDGRVALYYRNDDGSATVEVFEAHGAMSERLALWTAVDGGEQEDSTEYRAENYYDSIAVVWHDRLGLIVNHDLDAFLIRPAPEALPQKLPQGWGWLSTFDFPKRGHRLSGGRVLLLYGTFGIVVEK